MYIAHCTLPSTILSKAFYGLVAAHSTRDTGHGSGQKAEFPIPCLDDNFLSPKFGPKRNRTWELRYFPLHEWTTELNSGAIQRAKQHDRYTGAKPFSFRKLVRFKHSGRALRHLVVSLLHSRWFSPASKTFFWMTRAAAQARGPRSVGTMTQIN